MNIEIIEIEKVIPYARNPRKNTNAISKVSASLKEFGWQQPIVVDKELVVIAGHTRLESAKLLNMKTVPIHIAKTLTPEQVKAYRLADNRVSQEAEWDDELLKLELGDLSKLNFDLNLTGFDDKELNSLLTDIIDKGLTDEDEIPETPEEPISKLGDIWKLGNHRVMCGDSKIQDEVKKLMDNNLADLLHTDPPYNVNYSNAERPNPSKKDLGKIKNDVMSKEDFYLFLKDCFTTAYTFLKEDSSAYIWHSSAEQINFTKSFIDAGFIFSQQIIWKKPMLLGRAKYQWSHEPCLFGNKGSPYFTDDRKKTTVWDFGGYDKSKNLHPTQKPMFIPEEAINNSSKQGSNVLDLFGGSGSTLIACEKLGRNCYIMELDPKYCDVIIKRWQDYTGKKAIHTENNKTFNEIG